MFIKYICQYVYIKYIYQKYNEFLFFAFISCSFTNKQEQHCITQIKIMNIHEKGVGNNIYFDIKPDIHFFLVTSFFGLVSELYKHLSSNKFHYTCAIRCFVN